MEGLFLHNERANFIPLINGAHQIAKTTKIAQTAP